MTTESGYPIEYEECEVCGAILDADKFEIGVCGGLCSHAPDQFEPVRRRDQIEQLNNMPELHLETGEVLNESSD